MKSSNNAKGNEENSQRSAQSLSYHAQAIPRKEVNRYASAQGRKKLFAAIRPYIVIALVGASISAAIPYYAKKEKNLPATRTKVDYPAATKPEVVKEEKSPIIPRTEVDYPAATKPEVVKEEKSPIIPRAEFEYLPATRTEVLSPPATRTKADYLPTERTEVQSQNYEPELTRKNIEKISAKASVIEVWDSNTPSNEYEKVFEDAAKKYKDVYFARMDIATGSNIIERLVKSGALSGGKVNSTPCTIFMSYGKELGRFEGNNQSILEEKINKHFPKK